MTEQEADEKIERLFANRAVSMTPEARVARLNAWAAGKKCTEGKWLDRVREKAESEYPDNTELQYEYVLGVAQTINNLARDIAGIDYRDTAQPEGKKRK